jgi:hypothetical protein
MPFSFTKGEGGLEAMLTYLWRKWRRKAQEAEEARIADAIHRERTSVSPPLGCDWEIRKRKEARVKYERCVGKLHENFDPDPYDSP